MEPGLLCFTQYSGYKLAQVIATEQSLKQYICVVIIIKTYNKDTKARDYKNITSHSPISRPPLLLWRPVHWSRWTHASCHWWCSLSGQGSFPGKPRGTSASPRTYERHSASPIDCFVAWGFHNLVPSWISHLAWSSCPHERHSCCHLLGTDICRRTHMSRNDADLLA